MRRPRTQIDRMEGMMQPHAGIDRSRVVQALGLAGLTLGLALMGLGGQAAVRARPGPIAAASPRSLALPFEAAPLRRVGAPIAAELKAAMAARPEAPQPVLLLLWPSAAPEPARAAEAPERHAMGPASAERAPGPESPVDRAAALAARADRKRRAGERALAARSRFEAASAELMQRLEAEQAAGRVAHLRPLWLADALALEARPEQIRALALRPEVRMILPDRELRLEPPPTLLPGAEPALPSFDTAAAAQWNVRQVHADDVWNLLGIDGSGVTVAVVDTGVDYHHPLLQSRYRGFRPGGAPNHGANWWCRRGEDAFCGAGEIYPVDGYGHGSHVAGTILGGGGVGVAPGASWIAARACGSDSCRFSWIVDAIGWMVGLGAEAPDVINLSLGTDDEIEKLLFEPVINRAVGAGIVVVAATGNSVDNLRAPASLTATIGVGATTREGEVWNRSARGISKWWETKPDLVAPGTGITSTVPGGGLGLDTGTSMATPHVAGVAALLLEARPWLQPAEVKEILRRTATPIGEGSRPDSAAGWGRVNAYAAVASVMDVGQLRGRVVRLGDTKPITWAQVTVADSLGDPLASVQVAPDDGSFKVDLPPGDYLVIGQAFGFQRASRRGVGIRSGAETWLELALDFDEPMGVFEGRVTEQGGATPVAARIEMQGVPFPVASDETTGFSQRLPAGEYGLRIAKFGYRAVTDTITVKAGETLHRDYQLAPAPRILLVDGDAWSYNAAIDYYRASLDRLGYVYDTIRVTDERAGPGRPGGPPLAETLAGYDLVIWASPVSSPNLVMGAWELLAYLDGGGRLLLSGQDALCNDAGRDMAGRPCNQNAPPQPYLREKLKLRVLEDFARVRGQVVGAPDGPLAGMTLTLNGPGSMDNQVSTDVLEVTAGQNARLLATYPGGQGAGVLADTCLAHRAIALGFGFEGIAGAGQRDRVMERLIEALMAPAPALGLYAELSGQDLVRPAGASAQYTLTLLNTGASTGSFTVSVAAAGWPTELWDASFARPAEGRLALGSCRGDSLGIQVRVPEGAPHGDADTAMLRVASASSVQTLSLRTRAPAPVLVVDGDYVTESEARYLTALDAAGVRYDTWELGLLNIQPRLPTTQTLLEYPMLLWFTGYNLLHPERNFGLEDQRRVAAYLDAGGRLLLSSEDYLFHWGETPFANDRLFHRAYLGLSGFVDNGGAAHQGPTSGSPGSVLEGIQGCRLTRRRPDRDFSDRLSAVGLPSARVAMRNAYGQPIAVQNAPAGGFKTLFLAFDAGELEQSCADALIGRAVDWFSPLGASTLGLVDARGQPERRRTFGDGETLRLQLKLKHAGPYDAKAIDLRWSLPEGGAVDPADLPPELSLVGDELVWRGALARFGERTFELPFRLDSALPDALAMASEARIESDGVTIRRRAAWRVNAPDISGSSKSVPDGQRDLAHGDLTTFVVNVVNAGTRPLAGWRVTDTLPAGLALVEDSWLSEHGQVDRPRPDRLVWTGGGLPAGSATSLTYLARVVTRNGGWLTNRAELLGADGQAFVLAASVFSRPQLLLPWLGWQRVLDP
ncbi:MAG: S8 family serine peptidase [Chloroflexi bacterium]|nr:S8 family serine peptidase [Chloroflexota bacterium]